MGRGENILTKYLVYKIIEADGWSDEGKKIIDSNAIDGFAVAHGDYVISILKQEFEA